jgi:hypothetical protein
MALFGTFWHISAHFGPFWPFLALFVPFRYILDLPHIPLCSILTSVDLLLLSNLKVDLRLTFDGNCKKIFSFEVWWQSVLVAVPKIYRLGA